MNDRGWIFIRKAFDYENDFLEYQKCTGCVCRGVIWGMNSLRSLGLYIIFFCSECKCLHTQLNCLIDAVLTNCSSIYFGRYIPIWVWQGFLSKNGSSSIYKSYNTKAPHGNLLKLPWPQMIGADLLV